MAEEIDRYYYERTAAEHGFECVCGIDEAGRGPLAGPVFAAAVILPKDYIIEFGISPVHRKTFLKKLPEGW